MLLLQTPEVGGRSIGSTSAAHRTGRVRGFFGICSVSQQPPEGTDFTTGTAWKVLHLLPGRGTGVYPKRVA